jgi:hypothetical protein
MRCCWWSWSPSGRDAPSRSRSPPRTRRTAHPPVAGKESRGRSRAPRARVATRASWRSVRDQLMWPDPAPLTGPGQQKRRGGSLTGRDAPLHGAAGQNWPICTLRQYQRRAHQHPQNRRSVYVRRVLGQGRGSPTVKRGPIAGERTCLRALSRHQSACATGLPGVPAGTATAAADDPAACVSSSPDEPKLFGLSHNDAVANASRERHHQESAGQTAHNAP